MSDGSEPPEQVAKVREAGLPVSYIQVTTTTPAGGVAALMQEHGLYQQPWYWASALQGISPATLTVATTDVGAARAFLAPLAKLLNSTVQGLDNVALPT